MQPKMSLRSLTHSRPDLPRPAGVEVSRHDSVTIYLPDLSAFEAWREALEQHQNPTEADGWRSCTGWLSSDEAKALVTLRVRLTEGTEG